MGLEDEVTSGPPRFSWLKNGKPFTPEERFKVIYKVNILQLDKLTKKDK